MDYKSQLDIYNPDLISAFLETGVCKGIPPEIQDFLKQMQWAAELFEYERNITRCAKQLRVRILSVQKKAVDLRTCKARIYSAIDYFSIDCNVSEKVWESNFADRYENLATAAIDRCDYKTAKLCTDSAMECRRRASATETDKDWAPVFLINSVISLEDLGFHTKKKKEIARKCNDGFYIKMIDSLQIDKSEKERLRRDANIQDVKAEEITEE